MEREEFLKSLGLGLALVCTGSCFSACGKDDEDNGGNAMVDLSTSLKEIGSQTAVSGILIYRIASGNQSSSFVAVQKVCPHAQGNLNWSKDAGKVICDKHGATFSSDGTVLSQPTGGGTISGKLKVYLVTVSGDTLTVTA